MSKSTEPNGVAGSHGAAGPRFRLDTGLTLLARWSETATQTQKNAVYKALFAVTDGTVFRRYIVFDDREHSREFSVMVKEDLVIKIRILDVDAFAIRYIGNLGSESNVDLGVNPGV